MKRGPVERGIERSCSSVQRNCFRKRAYSSRLTGPIGIEVPEVCETLHVVQDFEAFGGEAGDASMHRE